MDTTNGFIVIDKPSGCTSRDVVNNVQRWVRKGVRVGHTGTLDPLATGVLVVCVGAATRLADLIQGAVKCYHARFRLGATSDTDDADGTIEFRADVGLASEADVRSELAAFVGSIEQCPPAYSAVKLGGKRAHELVRAGRATALKPRIVQVYAITLVGYDWPYADVQVECGKGTYIRSIARDLGTRLGTGGLVETLRRTRVGRFTLGQGVPLDSTPEVVCRSLLPMSMAVADMPQVSIDSTAAGLFRCGVAVGSSCGDPGPAGSLVALFDSAGELVGTGTATPDGLVRPHVVLDRWK